MSLTVSQIVLIVGVALFTAIAAVIDFRTRRIPNFLTLPAFLVGLVYQVAFHWSEPALLLDALFGFGIGFGTLFCLWLIGGGGGGDVKLMGAVSIWLGYKMTVFVLILSTLFVVIGTGFVILYSIMVRGFARTKTRYVSKEITESTKNKRVVETLEDRKQRRIMTYALPVALATWCVLGWFHFKAPKVEKQAPRVQAQAQR